MALLSTVYTSEAKVIRYLGSVATTKFADHDADGTADTDVVNDCINQATEETDFYLRERYKQSDLSNSRLVSRWATVMAVKFLMDRRGNPPSASVKIEFDRITDSENGFLVKVADGIRDLPGIELRAPLIPTMSNIAIDRRHQRSVSRVVAVNSSDAESELEQDTLIELPGVFD